MLNRSFLLDDVEWALEVGLSMERILVGIWYGDGMIPTSRPVRCEKMRKMLHRLLRVRGNVSKGCSLKRSRWQCFCMFWVFADSAKM